MNDLMTPQQAADFIPGMSVTNLAQLRYRGTGPQYLRPTPRLIVYRRSDLEEWLEAGRRKSTQIAS